jgi:hypothetical protein
VFDCNGGCWWRSRGDVVRVQRLEAVAFRCLAAVAPSCVTLGQVFDFPWRANGGWSNEGSSDMEG